MAQNTEKAVNNIPVYRKERKFAIAGQGISAVEFVVKSHPAMFSTAYPPRSVNNIYFDTPKHQNYRDNVVGSANRHKFRIRWYGAQFGYVEKPVLEIKIKKGLAGTKKHFPLLPFTLEEGFSQDTANELIARSDLPPEVKEMLKYLSPALLNRYDRKYYLSANRKFRITLDHKLSYVRIARYQNYFMRRVNDHDQVVLELKYEREDDKEATWITDNLPFRLSKNSKYVNGLNRLDIW